MAEPTVTQPIIDLYDEFTHGRMNRRDFMDRLATLAGGAAAAQVALTALANDYARAETVAENDPRIKGETVSWDGPDGRMSGALVRPAVGGKRPAVIVIHENRGLNPHIRDVTRRMALEGFLALGVDALSPQGGTPADEDRARDLFGALQAPVAAERIRSAVPFLAGHAESNGKVGAVGFCWGGGMVNELAVREPTLAAGVAYYGRQVAADRVPAIRAALLLHYAGNDTGINPGIEAYEAALRANNKEFQLYRYEGTQHSFNNDTAGPRYDATAAATAWQRTVTFLHRYLD